MPASVSTGRDLDEIAAQSDRVWGPHGEIPQNKRATGTNSAAAREIGSPETPLASGRPRNQSGEVRTTRSAAPRAAGKRGADADGLEELLARLDVHPGRLPRAQAVELATLVDAAPSGDDWLHEIKFDGYRMICRVANGKARFISRNGNDWTRKLPELAQAAGELSVKQAILDGEVVSLKDNGTTSFHDLQNAFQAGRTDQLVYYVFDILHLDGRDLTAVPLTTRKAILQRAIFGTSHRSIRYSDYLEGTGEEIIHHACRLHLEGIVSKPGFRVPARPRPRLAEGEVPETRGVCHWRLYQARWPPRPFWCLVAGVLRPWPEADLCRPRWHGFQ